jgi:hypothetical protein
VVLLACAVAPIFADPALGAWHQPVGGASPINEAESGLSIGPSLTSIGGVPYVAWSEHDGTNYEIRVARLNAAGTAWEKVADSASPINESTLRDAQTPSLTSIGGVPYVAWTEADGTNNEIRVARLNSAGTAWEKVADSASPINESPTQSASQPSLTSIGGVPYVAWSESDATNNEIRVARLNSAGTAWEKVADSASPINESSTQSASQTSLTSIGGVPYVAWSESDGTNGEIRVAGLNAAGTAWEKVADSASPINESPIQNTGYPSLTSIDGVAYVAWTEADGTNNEIRVARLNSAGTAWEKVADSASPINESSTRAAFGSSLTAIDGVPYVAWSENDGAVFQIRVSRLEPELVSQNASPASTSAELSATWHTYGLQFPLGFDYGATLERSTAAERATAGSDTSTVTQQISGLTPSMGYAYRPFATAGVPQPRLLGTTTVFTTLPPPDITRPDTQITKQPNNKLDGSKANYKFTSSEPNSTFLCKFDKAKFKPCSSPHKLKHLDDGKHRFRVEAVDAAGNIDLTPAKDKFRIL